MPREDQPRNRFVQRTSSPLRLGRQHKQFMMELSKLSHIAHVFGEGRHHSLSQCVGAIWRMPSSFLQQFVILDALPHLLEAYRYEHSIVFWVRVNDSVITGRKGDPTTPIWLNIFERLIRPEIPAPVQVTSKPVPIVDPGQKPHLKRREVDKPI